MRVALLSLEPWDNVWRRNQHLATRLVAAGIVESLLFVTPPAGGFAGRARRYSPAPGIEVVTPPLIVPRRYGGHRLLAVWLRQAVANADLLWINDPVAGWAALRPGNSVVYDVTDDWREMAQNPIQRERIVAAENALASRSTTVVCSDVLAERWMTRYGVHATVVQNGVDVGAIRGAVRRKLPGHGPHAVYVGTLHTNRLDVALVAELAVAFSGTVHLVGPDHLDVATRGLLESSGVQLHGPAPSHEVPSWLVSADVLICPHVVDEFTLSLDAIKSHEYLATDRPVVATKTSGFQSLTAPELTLTDRVGFVQSTVKALGKVAIRTSSRDWAAPAAEFGVLLISERRSREPSLHE